MAIIRAVVLLFIGIVTGLVLGKVMSASLEVEMLVGILVALVLGLFVIEGFARFGKKFQLTEQVCPKCGRELKRLHRTSTDRMLNVFIPNLRRYSCSSPTCTWKGLVVSKSPHHGPD